ncbi:synaptonemal complex protein 1-like isoform X2 [Coccinella septempunctata]|nr:synaptonemal complex protein 1-like isoform X2 [Coccinella septempunctata]XP_044754674.1 synaptonemal complex protein 1-like isoform X2 [Coccinella septempunctata]
MIESQCKELPEESSSSNLVQGKDRTPEPSSSSTSTDVRALEDQIEHLKVVVNNLKDDIEKKELGIAKLAREKEKISLDLMKQKRSNTNIMKQLEEERKFYFQEKETYCNEMKEIKALKKSLSRSHTSLIERPSQDLKNELENTKLKLKQTLEANYNLSIKFLRIKNTKAFLRNEMIKMKIEHERIFNDLRSKIETMSSEVEDIVDHRSHLYVSPSNRKYVQLVRQNSSLVHENLCLQMEIDRLNSQFDKMKLKYTKSETNNRLKYIHSIKAEAQARCKHEKKEKKRVRITTEDRSVISDEKPNKMLKSNLKTTKCQSEIIKIFERSESADTPTIQMVNEENAKKQHHKKHKKSCKKTNSKTRVEHSKSDVTVDVENKKNETPSHKPCVIKLASIAEIDESGTAPNKNGR